MPKHRILKAAFISLALSASLSSYAIDSNSAQTFLNPSANYTPSAAHNGANLPKPAFKETSRGFFISVAGSYVYMKLPDFTYGSVMDANFLPTTSAAFRFKNRVSTVMPSVTIGKYFYGNRFLPIIFGQRIGIVLKGSYWSDTSSDQMAKAPDAWFWPIDGSMHPIPIFGGNVLHNVHFEAKNRFWHGAVLITGHSVIGNSSLAQFSRDFRIGFVYYNLHQDFNFSAERVASANPQFNRPVTLSERTNTDYIGAQIGSTLNAQFNPNVGAFIKGDIALVCAKTDFSGSQVVSALSVPVVFSGYTASASDSNSEVTYIADLGGGLHFKASGFPVILTLAGGVQFFGYVPRIENSSTNATVTPLGPTSTTGPSTVVGTTAINPYGTVEVTLPF